MPTILTHILMTQKDKEVTTTWHLFWKKCINCQATNQPLPKTPTKSFSSVSWSRLGHSMSTQPISAAVPAGVSKRLGVWLLSKQLRNIRSAKYIKRALAGTIVQSASGIKWRQTWHETNHEIWHDKGLWCAVGAPAAGFSSIFDAVASYLVILCLLVAQSVLLCTEHMKILLQVLQSHVERNWYRDNSRLSQSYPGKWEATGKTSTKTTTSRPPSTKWLWKIQGSIPSPSKS